MTAETDFYAEFASWTERLIEAERFDEYERDFKITLGERFTKIQDDGLEGKAVVAWLREPPNNIISTQDKIRLADIPVDELSAAVNALLAAGDLADRLDTFGEWLRNHGPAHGAQTTVASTLLMGSDPIAFPPYKTRAIQAAMKLAGRTPATGSPSERYLDFLEFCDRVVETLSDLTDRSVDRLDVQGACWVIGGWDRGQTDVLLSQQHEEFDAWRLRQSPRRATIRWWVNQKKTYTSERDGGLIWAPQQTKNGRKLKTHQAVLAVREGDTFVHYADGQIRAIGTAESDGYEATRPEKLPSGESWQVAGLKADVAYRELEFPISLSDLDESARKSAGGPFKKDGSVKQAYLFEVPASIRPHIEELVMGTSPPAQPFEAVVDAFIEATRTSGLDYGARHETLVRSFVTALATKPFVILTGLSGSGKTRLAQAFGHWLGDDAIKVVAVRPDWTSPDALLGFENTLSTPDDEDRYEWNVPETLRFILAARDNPAQPHLLVLDEMNLAHVERYFADVLSGMESNEPILPDLVTDEEGKYRLRSGSTGPTPLPCNLLVAGTVNVDETTYMFSPKVLDRANTFEFRVETEDLEDSSPPAPIAVAPPGYAESFLRTASSREVLQDELFETSMRTVHELLSEFDREFGHRTYQEACRFASLLRLAGEHDTMVALDLQISQKVLPRLHGSRRELSVLLERLGAFCHFGPGALVPEDFQLDKSQIGDSRLPQSTDKLRRMARKLADSQFVSFAG